MQHSARSGAVSRMQPVSEVLSAVIRIAMRVVLGLLARRRAGVSVRGILRREDLQWERQPLQRVPSACSLLPVEGQSSCATPEGVLNLSGNVAEWVDECSDTTGAGDSCNVRGGSYHDLGVKLRCGYKIARLRDRQAHPALRPGARGAQRGDGDRGGDAVFRRRA